MGELSVYYANQYRSGNRDVIGTLTAEEDNLLHARRLAHTNHWWQALMKIMQGLDDLYDQLGRRAEWQALVAEIVPDFVDSATDGPLPGREEQWSMVTEYRVRLAQEARQWAEAERLQRARVDWERRRAEPFLTALPSPGDMLSVAGRGAGGEGLSPLARNTIRNLAMSLGTMGQILSEQGKADCVTAYEEAAELLHRIDDRPAEAVAAFNLGHAYMGDFIPALRNLDQAEHWYRRSLELCGENDRLIRGQCHNQLGLVAKKHFEDARAAHRPESELLQHLNTAVGFYQQALTLLPSNAVDDLAVAHNQLGQIYRSAGDIDRALPHYREAARLFEAAGNLYNAGTARRNVALTPANAGRLTDALLYAQAALRNFAPYGDRAAEVIQQTQQLIAEIEAAMQRRKAEG